MEKPKKTKLRKLEVNSVDLVPAGANPEAHINLFKGKEEHPTWSRFVDLVKKSFGMDEGEIESVYKEHLSYEEAKAKYDRRKSFEQIGCELWDYTSALRESLESIVNDSIDGAEKERLMMQSVSEFNEAINMSIPEWADGRQALKKSLAEDEVKLYKQMEIQALEDRIAVLKESEEYRSESEAEDEDEEDEAEFEDTDEMPETEDGEEVAEEEEEETDMKINKGLLTADEQATLEALIMKAESDEEGRPLNATEVEENEEEMVEDAVRDSEELSRVKAENEELKKMLAMTELTGIAKSYDVLGKDPEELAKSLYTMKQAGMYDEYIEALDIAKAAKEKTDATLFTEIGKSRDGVACGVEEKIARAAAEIRKADPSMSQVQAIAKAWELNPDLIREYDRV